MRSFVIVALVLMLGACTAMDEIGVPPRLSPVALGVGAAAMSASEYPDAPAEPVRRFSLWNDRQSRLFTDRRALSVGDILTVSIEIDDRAQFKNESDRKRTVSRTLGLSASATAGSLSADGGITSGTSSDGSGATTRSESINLSVAAVVTDVLPNGNLVISGSQEVRVNAELRILTIAGIVRPSDIGANNTIDYERIAEARISYGGRGRLTEVQQPPYGQQLLDNVLPF
ncbi:flagellar basal body L-ring protein FlgH [Mesorhizobium sp. Z1-4]|uniref:flagellar basal body L-ring protein FlgH n=1 Tax=Mesorhizobium sp. Z1-4 TaxID=2448478 RepID=UPI000FD95AA5|nr:flagellar basal body L-ring protein FlgH [Mesorhizobium sp. Z1-4]